VVGGLVSALFPAHPIHPFDASYLMSSDGRLSQGKTLSQGETPQAGEEVGNFAVNINTFLDKAGLILTNLDGVVGAVGNGIKGLETVDSPEKLLSKLQFAPNPADTSNFGVAKQALIGTQFQTFTELQNEMIKIAGFADAVSAVGIQLKAVGKDLTSIQVAGVSGGNADALTTIKDAQGQDVSYHGDLRAALNSDLPRWTYADTAGLDNEINTVNTFVNATLPQLLTPIEQTTSTLRDTIAGIAKTYESAINQSAQYGLDNAKVLEEAEQKAIAIVTRTALVGLGNTILTNIDRLFVAIGGGIENANRLTLHGVVASQSQETEEFISQWKNIFGDAVESTQAFQDAFDVLTRVHMAEYTSKVNELSAAFYAAGKSVSDTVAGFIVRDYRAQGKNQEADLLEYDVKAENEKRAFIDAFANVYGAAAEQTDYFAGLVNEIEHVQGEERLAIVAKYAQGITGTLNTTATAFYNSGKAVSDTLAGFIVRDFRLQGKNKEADLLEYDIKAENEKRSFIDAFANVYGAAAEQTDYFAGLINEIESVQGQERIAIVQKYATGATTALQDALKQAQTNVTSLLGSLKDYAHGLQSGDASPLSPLKQYELASRQFDAVRGAAAAGDYSSASQLQTYAESLLTTSRAVYGSGTQYADDVSRILDAISGTATNTDALTLSAQQKIVQDQTAQQVAAQQATTNAVVELQAEVVAMRRELQQQTRALVA
jgi:hypothetical protein